MTSLSFHKVDTNISRFDIRESFWNSFNHLVSALNGCPLDVIYLTRNRMHYPFELYISISINAR